MGMGLCMFRRASAIAHRPVHVAIVMGGISVLNMEPVGAAHVAGVYVQPRQSVTYTREWRVPRLLCPQLETAVLTVHYTRNMNYSLHMREVDKTHDKT